MVNITHRIGIKASATHVFQALSSIKGLAGWWTEEVSGSTEIDGKITFIFRATNGELKGQMVMQVAEATSPELLRWRCIDGPAEWIGTDICFELSQEGEHTIVIFGHKNWREAVEFTAHCSMKWATFLLSLRAYVETGTGQPAPQDLKIDNWN
jgi:uncharacterized protein YndB with AHSA1/START domain